MKYVRNTVAAIVVAIFFFYIGSQIKVAWIKFTYRKAPLHQSSEG